MIHNINAIPQVTNRGAIVATNNNLVNNDVINNIQKNYLVQNANGTFSIKPIAYAIYSPEIMNNIDNGMNLMNSQILENNIKLKLTKNKNIEILNENKEQLHKNIFHQLNNNSPQFWMTGSDFIESYGYNFHYSWYGFYCAITINGCNAMANQLNAMAGSLAVGAGVSAEFIPLAVGAGISAAYCYAMASTFETGAENGVGCTVDALGSPSGTPLITNATVNN